MARNDEDEVERFVVREPSREVTFRAVVLVVVILLLTNLLIIVYFVSPYFNPDEGTVTPEPPEEDWLLPVEPRNITTDETWIGQDTFLERPVVVKDGAELRIEDCHLRVYLEDLLFWLRPAIQVESGATLTLVDSTLEVFQDPRLEASVVGAYQRPDHHIPYIARVVNLENAADPVFHMDVSYLGNATRLAVGVLPGVDEDLVLLDILDPPTSERHQWHHLDVSLASFAGTTPWVVVWFESYPDSVIFVGNLSVTDGDGWPEGDAFPTGHPMKDGWAVSRFYSIPYIQSVDFSRYYYLGGLDRSWQPLIDAEGDVEVSDSHILAPEGTEHRTGSDIYKEKLDPKQALPIDRVGSRGGHVQVVGGDLVVDGSTIENVPVTGRNASVSFARSTFEGESDLVSLLRPSGEVRGCTFTTRDLPAEHRFNSFDHRYIWALGIEGSSPNGPLSVQDCTFEGGREGLEASRADLVLDGCEFRGMSGLAIWDHLSDGLDDWDDVSSRNTFEDVLGNTYLRTDITDVEFVHPDLNASDISVHSGTSLSHGLELYSPFSGKLKAFYGNRARYIIPEVLVTRTGAVQTSPGVSTRISWEYTSERFEIPPNTASMTIDLQELFCQTTPVTDLFAPMEVERFIPGEVQGTYMLVMAITDLQGLRVIEPTMGFKLDGGQSETINLTEDDVFVYPSNTIIKVWRNLTIPGGWHELVVSVNGRAWLEGDNYTVDPVEVDSYTLRLLVMGEDVDFEPWMPLEADMVVVPAGLSVSIGSLAPRDGGQNDLVMDILAGNASSLDVDCSDLPPECSLRVLVPSNLTLDIHDASIRTLQVTDAAYEGFHRREVTEYDRAGDVTISGAIVDSLYMVSYARTVDISGVSVLESSIIDTYYNSYLTINDSSFEDASPWLTLTDGRLEVRNCTFSSTRSVGLVLEPELANVTLADCTFDNAYLMLFFDNWYWATSRNLSISGCRFSGEESVLYVGWDIYNVDSYDLSPDFVPQVNGSIEGNTFSGPGCHVVLGHGLFGQLWGDNQLEGGAVLQAFYITRLQVIPPDGTPFWGAYDFLPVEGITTDWPFSIFRWVEMDGEILWDVTTDPSVEEEPPTLDVILYSKWGSYRMVRGFSQVVPNADNDEATYPVFPDFLLILRENVSYWPPLEEAS